MCGIAGFCDLGANYLAAEQAWRQALRRMRQAVRHRGGDQAGEYLGRHVGLAHARLAIRDIAGGAQPMLRTEGGRSCAIVYNGEVYNAGEQRAALQRAGCRFATSGDTEVILYAYMRYGPGFVRRLNGIFAFAIWDEAAGKLLLYRDRLGVKPLFYMLQGARLVFGSEPKALFAHPDITPRADLDSFREVFGIGPARTPGCGVFQDMQELLPGCMAEFGPAGFARRPYWQLQAAPHTHSYAQTVACVSALLRDAVRRQLVSDVPVCSFLSGGIDSSVVTALASRELGGKGVQLNTFSFDFAHNDECFEANDFQPSRDRPYVDKVLALYPLRHTYLTCGEAQLAGLLDEAVAIKDLPGMTDIDASLLYFCRLVSRRNKVALTGECADEIFGGYPWFYRPQLMEADTFPWAPDLAARTLLLSDDALRRLQLQSYVQARYRQWVQKTPALPDERGLQRRRREISYLNIRWFMQTLLDRMDRTSMASGLEARVPFADHRLVEYLYNVPWHMKYRPGHEKALLREACRDLLPPQLLWRKKSPYPKTYSPQYEALLCQRMQKVLQNPASPILRYIDRPKTERFLAAPKSYGRPWFGQLMAGPQLVAYLLQVNTWMVRYGLE